MKVLFLTLARIDSIEVQGIYQDLLRKFRDKGHELFIVSPSERKYKNKTQLYSQGALQILNVWTTSLDIGFSPSLGRYLLSSEKSFFAERTAGSSLFLVAGIADRGERER